MLLPAALNLQLPLGHLPLYSYFVEGTRGSQLAAATAYGLTVAEAGKAFQILYNVLKKENDRYNAYGRALEECDKSFPVPLNPPPSP